MRGFVFLLFAGVPLVAFLAYRSWKQEQERRDLLFQWSTHNGYTFVVEDDGWCNRWSGAPFSEGDHRRARNVVTGHIGDRPFAAFDYSYQTHSSDGKGNTTTTTHHFVVASLQLPTYLPGLQVTPESVFSRIGNVLGFDDIELESEDFNRHFRVGSRDRKFACDVLTPRTMEALLKRPSIGWRIEGTDILGWQDGELTPSEFVSMTGTLQTVVAGIPSFVWKDNS